MNSYSGKTLVIRNDKLGDFMLAWPALSLLKQHYPDSTVTVLIPSYTRPMAEICPWIDEIIIDDHRITTLSDAKYLANIFMKEAFDVSITLFSEFRVGLGLWKAGVPTRIAPATKIAQIFYNRKLVQRRSRSEKPEFEYNADLVRHFIKLNGDEVKELQPAPFLEFDSDDIRTIRKTIFTSNNIDTDKKLVYIHPGSGGSANNLSTQQYADLVIKLAENNNLYFIITAGPDELEGANALSGLITNINHTVYHSTKGLVNFSKYIAACDLFISGSTGPLHIAGALNCNTAAFYPTRRSATSLRWQTLNEEKKRLAFSPEEISQNSDMSTINPLACAKKIQNTFF